MSKGRNYYVYGLFDSGVIFYVGMGTGDRLNDHARVARGRARRGVINTYNAREQYLINLVRYDPAAFEARKLATRMTRKEAFAYEVELIELYGRQDLNTGILRNLNAGGYGGREWGVSSREKAAAAKRGRVLTEEHKAAIGAAHLGKVVSLETRLKMRKLKSPEHIAKITAAARRENLSEETQRRRSLAMIGNTNGKRK